MLRLIQVNFLYNKHLGCKHFFPTPSLSKVNSSLLNHPMKFDIIVTLGPVMNQVYCYVSQLNMNSFHLEKVKISLGREGSG